MTEYAPQIRETAFRALRAAGLLHDDPDLVGLFALDGIKVVAGRAVVPPNFVKTARAGKPDLFDKDGMDMSPDELRAAIAKIERDNAKLLADAATARVLRELQARFA